MKRSVRLVAFLIFAMFMFACSGGSSTSSGTNGDGGTDARGGHHGDAAGDGASDETLTIGGTVSGLSGKGLTLQNGSKTLAVSADGSFTFKAKVASGTKYDVTVSAQPTGPSQKCTVSNGEGTAKADVKNVKVTCATSKFTVGGTVIGLKGTGLVLENSSADDLTVTANGTFTFATPVASGSSFSVTVQTQPSTPTQTCTVTGGTGTVGGADVTDVMINCGTDDFVIGGQITGLAGANVVLQDNGGDDLTVTANGTFAFKTPVASGGAYAVTVSTEPSSPTQTCIVSMGTGTVGNANVTSVSVACTTNTYTVGGTVTGLAGTGLVLQDNAGDNLTVSASGTFTFATPVVSGGAYAVTVLTQPTVPTQDCIVSMGTGTITNANVTSVSISCVTATLTVGGTITGLAATDSVVLQDNGGDNLTVSANGAFTFASPIASGATYNVTVLTEPGAPTQTCTVSGGMGTVVAANIMSVTVNCTTNTYTVGGTVTGLAGTLVLEDNGADDLTLTANGTFAFATPIASEGAYAVTVLTQPGAPAQTCLLANDSGTVTNANITNVTITCTTNTYTVGGTLSGLAAGESVVLQDNGSDNLTVNGNGTFTFVTPIASAVAFDVEVLTNPASPLTQTCVATSNTGTIGAANVTSVVVTCTTNTYTIGGTVSGLVGTGLVLQDNGVDSLGVTTNGPFTFATPVLSGGAYSVVVQASPTTPWQTCAITNPSGSVTSANITNVTVVCTINKYTVGGNVTGLAAGDTLVLQDNGGDNLTVSATGAFTFPTSLTSGTSYAVTILAASGATAQTCSVSGGTGTVGGGNVTSVAINCTTNKYTIGGTVSGLAGTGLVLQDNGGDNLVIMGNGSFAFATPIASDAAYNVTVLGEPLALSQTCVVASGSGTVGSANVTNVTVTCTTNKYTIGGTLSGLATGDSVVLQDNGANNLTLGANGAFTFATSLASGSAYSVTVLTSPASPSQNCVVTLGSGTVTSANVTNVVVTCVTDTCPAETASNCVLTTTNSGSTDTGTCAAGYSGSCSYSCSVGTWTQVTDTCAPFLSHNISDGTYAYMSGWDAQDVYKVDVSTGMVSTLTSSGPLGGYTMAFNNGVLYAATPWGSPTLIYTVNTTTGVFTTFATFPAELGDAIDGIWFDPSGNIYANSGNTETVYKVTPAGVVSTFISNDGHLNENVTQGTCDGAGNFYIPSRSVSEIIVYNSSGTYVSTLTTTCPPWGVAVSSGNLLYTCDGGSIYALNLSTLANSTWASPGGSLAYLSADAQGDVYVGQWTGTSAWKLSSAGATLWTTSLPAGEASGF